MQLDLPIEDVTLNYTSPADWITVSGLRSLSQFSQCFWVSVHVCGCACFTYLIQRQRGLPQSSFVIMVLVIYVCHSPDRIKCHSQSHLSVYRLQHTFWDIIIWCQTDWESRQSVIWPTNHSFTALTVSHTFSRTAGIGHRKKKVLGVMLLIPSSPLEYRARYPRCDILLKLLKATYSYHMVTNCFL